MNAIQHRVEFDASPEQVFRALTEVNQLSAWWTAAEAETGKQGQLLHFKFGAAGDHVITMEVTAAEAYRAVSWICRDGPWVDTDGFQFSITASDRGAVLLFSNPGWLEASEFFIHCNSKWGYFLAVSLKQLVETGQGQPHPLDPNI